MTRLTLRVMAPPARKGTALEEYRRADARAIVDGVFLDVEDDSGLGHVPSVKLFCKKCQTKILELDIPNTTIT